MINNIFRTYKKIIISILVLLSAAMFLFYSCHRGKRVEEKTSTWERVDAVEGNGSTYRFETEKLKGTVVFGTAGFIPRDRKVPVLLQVSCKKDSFIGVMKITLPGQSGSGIDYQAAVSCVKGVVTRVDLTVPYLGNPSCFGFAIHDSFGTEEISRPVVPDWADRERGQSEDAGTGNDVYVGFISDRPEKLSYIDGLEFHVDGEKKTLRAVLYSRRNMPRKPAELDLLDGLVLDNVDTSAFDQGQKECIREYVAGRGKTLVLALGKYHQKVLSGMEELIGKNQYESRDSGLLFTNKAINSEDVSLSLTSLAERSDRQWNRHNFSTPESCWTKKTGNGRTTLVSFSLQDGVFLQWSSRDQVCTDLLGGLLGGDSGNEEEENISLWYMQKTLYAFLHSQMPSTFFYGCLFVLYLFLLVVFAYYYLRRKKKREWIWGVVPLLSVLFTAFMAIRSLGIAGLEGSTYSSIRIVDTRRPEDRVYFLYQNGEKEEADVNFLPTVTEVVPLDYQYRTDSTGEENLVCSSKVLTVNHTKNGYSVLFDEQIPGSSRLLELGSQPVTNEQTGNRNVFTMDLKPGKAFFEGSVRNVSGEEISVLAVVRGNEYAVKKNIAAGEKIRIGKEDIRCFSDAIPAGISDNETSVAGNLLSYIKQIYMKPVEGSDQVILIGFTDEDDFKLFSDKNKLKNHITLFVNYFGMPGKEGITRLSNINDFALQETGEVSSLEDDYLDGDWVEARYAFDKYKLVWSLTREKDTFKGTIYAYNYEEKRREKILAKPGDSMSCEELEPYLSEMNVMRLTYQLPNGVVQDAAPLLCAELKEMEEEENNAGISESDDTK